MAASALRFYEDRGLVASERAPSGQRRYHPDVLRRLAFIRVAQRVGLSLDEISAALAELPNGRTPTRRDWERLSQRWRPRLDARIDILVKLRDQLTSCIGCGCLSLKTCALHNPDDAAARLGSGPRYLLGDSPADLDGP
jgi:MerR family redox-sensitive transcriptional activator SoxR